MFRKDSLYYFLGSHLSSWEKNDNYYFTATSLKGPWTPRGIFAPEGTLTWNSQTTFVLPIEGLRGTTFMFMGDRWSFPKQASAATYVWLPLTITGSSISIPSYKEAWQINTSTGAASSLAIRGKTFENMDKRTIVYEGEWKHVSSDTLNESSSDVKDASFSLKFTGRRIGLYSQSRPDRGYASIILYNKKGRVVLNAIVDMYCKYSVSTLKFLSPMLPKQEYKLKVSVMGERPNWSDKKRANYGSTANFISFDKIVVDE